MKWITELSQMLLVLFITVGLVALLWQIPWFLAILLLLPLGLSVWFWPEASTFLSYIVAAIMGTLFTGWSFIQAVEQPQTMIFSFMWLPLVWGPAGVLIKRAELLILNAWNKREGDPLELPKLR